MNEGILIEDPNGDDGKYARKLLQHPDDIKQSDLRDNMRLIKCDEEGLHDVLRSEKSEKEYQEWQEEVRIKVEERDKRNRIEVKRGDCTEELNYELICNL